MVFGAIADDVPLLLLLPLLVGSCGLNFRVMLRREKTTPYTSFDCSDKDRAEVLAFVDVDACGLL